MLTLVRNTGAVMVRTENAEGRIELDTALRDSTALPAATRLASEPRTRPSSSRARSTRRWEVLRDLELQLAE